MRKHPKPGEVFGRLTVVEEAERKHGRKHFLCKCECGGKKIVMMSNLHGGQVRSCGCLKRESPQNITHGQKGTRLYGIWNGMKTRCTNPNDKAFPKYGGRGIKICEEWMDFSS